MFAFLAQISFVQAAFVTFISGILVGTRRIWRLPSLCLFTVLLSIDLMMYVCVRMVVRVTEVFMTMRLTRRKTLQETMKAATTYPQWFLAAQELDRYERRQHWKERDDGEFHPAVIRVAAERLRLARQRSDAVALVDAIRPCLIKNFAGIMNYTLYTRSHCGTKVIIEEFVAELVASLDHLKEIASKDEAAAQSLGDFIDSALLSYGKTSLLMSGGGGLGFYHFGLLRALLAMDMLPQVICGTSMGAIVLGFLASRSNKEALEELEKLEDLYIQVGPKGALPGSKLWKLAQVIKKGYIYELEGCEEHLAWFTQGMTFREAFDKTGRCINITCTPRKTRKVDGLPSLILNHITTPHVTLTSAVLASSCIPCLFLPIHLMEKLPDGTIRHYQGNQPVAGSDSSLDLVQMRDGSFENDVPVQAMGVFFNSQFSIVSQVNPHIIPFFFNPQGAAGRPVRYPWRRYRGGFLLSLIECWCKEDMIKNLRIMHRMGLLFRVFGVDWSYLFIQGEVGDITIVPNATMLDYWRMGDNQHSRKEFADIIRQSERRTWRHMAIISNRMRIEQSLEALAAVVRGS